jgi:hypothetical protein
MGGHIFAFIKTFHDICRKPDIKLFFDHLVRHAVIMPIDFDMIVDVHPGFFPLGELVAVYRQWF